MKTFCKAKLLNVVSWIQDERKVPKSKTVRCSECGRRVQIWRKEEGYDAFIIVPRHVAKGSDKKPKHYRKGMKRRK